MFTNVTNGKVLKKSVLALALCMAFQPAAYCSYFSSVKSTVLDNLTGSLSYISQIIKDHPYIVAGIAFIPVVCSGAYLGYKAEKQRIKSMQSSNEDEELASDEEVGNEEEELPSDEQVGKEKEGDNVFEEQKKQPSFDMLKEEIEDVLAMIKNIVNKNLEVSGALIEDLNKIFGKLLNFPLNDLIYNINIDLSNLDDNIKNYNQKYLMESIDLPSIDELREKVFTSINDTANHLK